MKLLKSVMLLCVLTALMAVAGQAEDFYYYYSDTLRIYVDVNSKCITVDFDPDYEVDPYEYAASNPYLKYDPRLSEYHFPFSLFHIKQGYLLKNVMDIIRADSSVLLVNPVKINDQCYASFIWNQIIVTFKPGINNDLRDSLLAEFGLNIIEVLQLNPPSYVLAFTGKTDLNTFEIGNALHETGYCLNTMPNFIYVNSSDLPKGDLNYDFKVNLADLIYLINYIFNNGSGPISGTEGGDLNCDLVLGLEDVIQYIYYIFHGQPLVRID